MGKGMEKIAHIHFLLRAQSKCFPGEFIALKTNSQESLIPSYFS